MEQWLTAAKCSKLYYAQKTQVSHRSAEFISVTNRTNKNGGVTVAQTNVFMISLTRCFGPDKSSSPSRDTREI
jgi:hypothetical protein